MPFMSSKISKLDVLAFEYYDPIDRCEEDPIYTAGSTLVSMYIPRSSIRFLRKNGLLSDAYPISRLFADMVKDEFQRRKQKCPLIIAGDTLPMSDSGQHCSIIALVHPDRVGQFFAVAQSVTSGAGLGRITFFKQLDPTMLGDIVSSLFPLSSQSRHSHYEAA